MCHRGENRNGVTIEETQEVNMKKSVLIIDDEVLMTSALEESLKRCGFYPVVYHDPKEALEDSLLPEYSLILTDVKMPVMNGLDLLKEIRQRNIFTPVVVITGYGTVGNAVSAMKLGASDYIMKPFSFESLKKVIDRLGPAEGEDMVAASPVMKNLLSMLGEVARSDITVLLTGESGVGKEVIARYIHQKSERTKEPFVAINCAAISESLLESELFGYEKGAFTGAAGRRKGKFELAHGGTLLLDEVSEMAYPLQAKLLRAIQEKEVDRLGGSSPIGVDVRIVATTNKDLTGEVRKGNFREDLFFRLNVFPVRIPPLRERRGDIVPLAEFILKRLSKKMGKALAISSELAAEIEERRWDGNVRELENYLYRLAVVCPTEELNSQSIDLPGKEMDGALNGLKIGKMKDMERDLIILTLKETQGNRTRAAKILGITTRTIRNKIKEFDIDNELLQGVR